MCSQATRGKRKHKTSFLPFTIQCIQRETDAGTICSSLIAIFCWLSRWQLYWALCVDVYYLHTFLFAATLIGYDSHNKLVRNDYQISIAHVAIYLMIFKAHMNILLFIKVKIVELIKWSYRCPQSCWLFMFHHNLHGCGIDNLLVQNPQTLNPKPSYTMSFQLQLTLDNKATAFGGICKMCMFTPFAYPIIIKYWLWCFHWHNLWFCFIFGLV